MIIPFTLYVILLLLKCGAGKVESKKVDTADVEVAKSKNTGFKETILIEEAEIEDLFT